MGHIRKLTITNTRPVRAHIAINDSSESVKKKIYNTGNGEGVIKTHVYYIILPTKPHLSSLPATRIILVYSTHVFYATSFSNCLRHIPEHHTASATDSCRVLVGRLNRRWRGVVRR